MTATVVPSEHPVDVICRRLKCRDAAPIEAPEQTAYAIIGALAQAGWTLARKRHARKLNP